MLLLLLNYVVLRALWKIDVHLKALSLIKVFIIIIIIIILYLGSRPCTLTNVHCIVGT